MPFVWLLYNLVMGQMDQRKPAWYRRPISTAWGMTAAGVVLLLFFLDASCGPRSSSHLSTGTLSNIKQLAMALRTYAADNNGLLPASFSTNEDIRAALASYDLDERIFETRNPDGGEILPNSELAGVKLSEVLEPDEIALLYETEPWSNGRSIYAFATTSVRSISADSVVKLSPGSLNPDAVPENNEITSRFRIGKSDYRLSGSGEPTFDVIIKKWDGKRWIVQYEGVSISGPIIKWESDKVVVFLKQPRTEIVGATQAPGPNRYERVTIDVNGVRSKLVDGWTIYQ